MKGGEGKASTTVIWCPSVVAGYRHGMITLKLTKAELVELSEFLDLQWSSEPAQSSLTIKIFEALRKAGLVPKARTASAGK